MLSFIFSKTLELKRTKPELEKILNVKIKIQGKKVTIEGSPMDEYEASLVLDAINFGFSAKKALSLKNENLLFRILNIKKITRKKNLQDVRARVIGKEGKTRKTIENITNSEVLIKDNEIGIIGNAESIDEISTIITNLVRGTKQSNVYRYLEKMNARQKSEKLL